MFPAGWTGARLFFLHAGFASTDRGSIMTCKPDGSDFRTLVSDLGTHPDGICVDVVKGHVYYTNMGADAAKDDGFISRVDLDGQNNITIIPKGITFTPKQCTIDFKSQKLYWCDREGMRVWRANLDGSETEVLYQSAQGEEARKDPRNHCVGIAVDTARRRIMWTQKGPPKGGEGRLFAAGINLPTGETPDKRSDVKVVMENLPEPIDLQMDYARQVIYKTDRGAEPRGNTVSRIHLNDGGKVVEEILANHLHEAIGLALDLEQTQMYFTDLGGSVYAAALDGSDKRVLLKGVGDLTGICFIRL